MEKVPGKNRMAGVIFKALLCSYFVTAVILAALAFVMLKLQPDMQKTGIAILACYVLSCFLGGWLCGRKAGKKKFLWGMSVGALYFLLLVLLSGMGDRALPVDTMRLATAFLLCAGSGMAGGMIS